MYLRGMSIHTATGEAIAVCIASAILKIHLLASSVYIDRLGSKMNRWTSLRRSAFVEFTVLLLRSLTDSLLDLSRLMASQNEASY